MRFRNIRLVYRRSRNQGNVERPTFIVALLKSPPCGVQGLKRSFFCLMRGRAAAEGVESDAKRDKQRKDSVEISRVLTLVGIGMGILALPACGGEEDAISTHDQSLRPQVGEVDAESGPDVTPSIVDAPPRPALCLAELQAVESADGDADARLQPWNS